MVAESKEPVQPTGQAEPVGLADQAKPAPAPADRPGSGIRMVSIDELKPSAARSAGLVEDERWH